MVAEIAELDGERMTDARLRAIVASESAQLPIIVGRPTDRTRDLFRNRGLTSILPRRNEKSWKVRADRDTIRTLRVIMDRDPDVSKAVENFILLVGKGYKATAYARTASRDTKREDPQAQAIIDEFDRRVGGEYGGGIESLIPVWIKTLLWHGAVANELEFADGLREVLDVHPVSPDLVSFKRDPESGRLRRGVMVPRSAVGDLRRDGIETDEDGFLELPERQFRYTPYHPHVNEHYGISPLIPVIAAIFFKVELLEDAKLAIHVNGHGRLDVSIDHAQIAQGMPENLREPGREEEARNWVRERIKEVSQAFQAIEADESFFHDSTVTAKPIAPTIIPDLDGIMTVIDNQVIAGTKQLPILLGRNEGATTTHATVQWQLFAVQVEAFARIIVKLIQWAHEQALAAAGRAAYTVVEFEPIRVSDRVADEQARTALINNWIAMIKQGWADNEEASLDVLNHPPVGEPEPPPVPPAPTAPDSGSGGGEGNTTGGSDGNEGTGEQSRAQRERGDPIPAHPALEPGASRVPSHGGAGLHGGRGEGHDPEHHRGGGDAAGGGQSAEQADRRDHDPGGPGHGLNGDRANLPPGPDRIGPGGINLDDVNNGYELIREIERVWGEGRAWIDFDGLAEAARRADGNRHNRPGDHPSGKGFASAKDGDAWAEKSTKSWAEGLSGAERDALETMKGDGFASINKKLRAGGPDKLSKKERETHDNAVAAIGKYETTRSIVTYRGVSSAALGANLDKLKAGHIFTDNGFGSTTFNPSISGEFVDRSKPAGSGVQLKVYVKKGAKVAYMEPFDKQGFGESEILLPPGTKYKVLRTGEDKFGRPVIAVEVQ